MTAKLPLPPAAKSRVVRCQVLHKKKKNTKMKTQTHMACIYVDKGNPEMRILDTKSMVVIRGVGKMDGWLRNRNELRLAHTLSYENYKQISHAVWIMIMRCGIVGPA